MARKTRTGRKDGKQRIRSDAERRLRQSERMSRVLRVLHSIMGPGRWNADSLAVDLECSTRTIHRILQTLSMAGVPWYFCKETQSYRVRPGFRFPGIDHQQRGGLAAIDRESVLLTARRLLEDGEKFLESLRNLCQIIEASPGSKPTSLSD